jgi:hypothetical protein
MSTTIARRRYLTNFEHTACPTCSPTCSCSGRASPACRPRSRRPSRRRPGRHQGRARTTRPPPGPRAASPRRCSPGDSPAQHAADTLHVGAGWRTRTWSQASSAEAPAVVVERLEAAGRVQFDRQRGRATRCRPRGRAHARPDHPRPRCHRDARSSACCSTQVRAPPHPRLRALFRDRPAVTRRAGRRGRHAPPEVRPPDVLGDDDDPGDRRLRAGLSRDDQPGPSRPATAWRWRFAPARGLRDMEMIQFHPTTLYVAGAARQLISEAVRGDGAHLVDRDGRRFMPEYDERAELASRDVVSRAITAEMKKARPPASTSTCATSRKATSRPLPATSTPLCRDFDIQPGARPDPGPAQRALRVGGVVVDAQGQTSLPGCWRAARSPRRACTAPTGWPAIRCSRGWSYGAPAGRLAACSAAPSPASTGRWRSATLLPHSPRTQLDLSDVLNSLARA